MDVTDDPVLYALDIQLNIPIDVSSERTNALSALNELVQEVQKDDAGINRCLLHSHSSGALEESDHVSLFKS